MPFTLRHPRLALAAMFVFIVARGWSDPLDPQRWHEPTRARSARVAALHEDLRRALAAEDASRITETVAALCTELGPEVSLPEAKPDYVGAPDTTPRKPPEFLTWWLEDCRRREGREPWDVAAAALRSGRTPNRLRDSQRVAEAYLATARLVGPEAGAKFRERALAGLRFIRSCQASTGVFGYPYDPKRTDRLGQHAAALVARGRKEGRTMTEGAWIIEDLGGGDLQFDNGVCGLAMLEAHALTGDRAFLASAVRAAEWAATRPLVPNWNYNAFSARLLARTHLATREERFLAAARRKFDLGVLPGQTATGRWFDPHNARTQYHAILCTALADYVELLEKSSSPDLARVRTAVTRALDNLAAQTLAFGVSNASEMLSLEAFHRGTFVLGRHPDWDRATLVTLNVIASNLRTKLLADSRRLPETIPFGLLQLGPVHP
ncbi:MAG: hypothetical protein HZC55_06905 [Verrucomicrobia bacterium]|nr:hypothetical protein [Verrucomicrobiota bacterium]